jgi:SNF2 family DNA or RNA helicase
MLRTPRSLDPASSSSSPLVVDGSEHFLSFTLPSREHPSHRAVLELVKSHGFTAEPSNGRWWLRDRHKTLNFLAAHWTRLRTEFGARFTPNFEKNTAAILPAEVTCAATESGRGYEITLSLNAGPADEGQVRAALIGGRGYVEAGGRIVLLDAARLEKLGRAQRILSGEAHGGVDVRRTERVGAARLAEVEGILEEVAPGFRPPAAWRERSAALRSLSALRQAPVPEELDARLRSYQRIGVAWLWHLYRSELGGILADEMGLGKTLQALALLVAVGATREGERLPSLVVCPASLLENWRREAERFAPGLRAAVHHGTNRLADDAFDGIDLVITSYGTLVRDQELFAARTFACIVADEAQHLKNRRSQNARSLRSLSARGRFVLTGTPVENSLDDLRSLFDFLMPGYMASVPPGTRASERPWFDERLRAQAAPYILRRTKGLVAPELPGKIEQTLWCEFAPAQAALYRAAQEKAERDLIDLQAGGASDARMRLAALTQLLRLRQICCDPRLLPDQVSPASSEPGSAKLEAFGELLAEALDDGHRVLVFSQFTSFLALVRADLEAQGVAHAYLDGSMPTGARQAEVDRFQAPDSPPVFLLSLKAGGSGLNLTGADTVVHLDPWWNPAAEAQATDRAHRIGQTRLVTSYKLVVSGTVEERVLGLQDSKRGLLAGVFEASEEAAARLSLDELKTLMR